jgi:CRISPR/Cas system-associated exonuclease Cas4 (RecB family)
LLTADELKVEAWTWSFSKFSRFQECQEQYRLQYIEKIKIPPLSQRPFFQGNVAHKVVEQTRERLVKGEIDSLRGAEDALEGVFRNYAAAINWRDDADIDAAWREACQILQNYLGMLEEMRLDAVDTECEYWFGTYQKPLEMPNGLRLIGAIDWLKLDREGKRAWVYDAKTSQRATYLDKRQLVLYAVAAEQVFGTEVSEGAFLMLRHQKPLVHEITKQDKAALLDELVAASRLVEAGATGAMPDMRVCGPCQYSGKCGPFRHWIMDGGNSHEVEW